MARFTVPSSGMLAVYEMMKDGSPAKFDAIVKHLGCSRVTAMVHICALRRDFNAEIETVREGRKVVAYTLTNADVIAPLMVSNSVTTKTPRKPKKTKPVKAPKKQKVSVTKTAVSTKSKSAPVTEDVGSYEVEEISDAELADLRGQLGI